MAIALDFEENNKMKLFKRKKRLKKLEDCPDIKEGCAFADSGILSYCREGKYVDCQYFQARREKKKNERR